MPIGWNAIGGRDQRTETPARRPNVETPRAPGVSMDVFVYGTLTDPERVRELLDSFVFVGAATLHGLHLVDGQYPTLAPGGETAGRLLRTNEVAALDAYERVGDGLYVRVAVPLDGGDTHPGEAAVYVGDPDRLGAAATWPGQRSFAERVRSYLATAEVFVAVDD